MRYYFLVIVMDSYGPELVEEHRDLVRAIKAGNSALARTRASDHLAKTARRSMRVDLRAVHAGADRDEGIEDELAGAVARGGQAAKKRSVTTRRSIAVRRQAGVPPAIRLR